MKAITIILAFLTTCIFFEGCALSPLSRIEQNWFGGLFLAGLLLTMGSFAVCMKRSQE